MTKVVYQEQFLSYEEQINLLKNRGLLFKDEARALNLFECISYYRFSSYWHPFLKDKQVKIFKENVNFDSIFDLYKFDADLRKIIMAEIVKIEIAVRSKMVYILSLSNDSFWLENEKLFSCSNIYASLISSIKKEIDRSEESFIISFKKEFSNDIPPAFMVLETASFGTLSKLYKYLKSSKEKQEIALFFGLLDKAFESWLHSLVYVRNICAHHSRLWNREMRISPLHPRTYKNQWLENKQIPNNRIYFILSIIIYLLNIINPKHSFKQKLNSLFLKYPSIDKAAMGFPTDWQKEPLWNGNP
ncbi:MAG: Abi family protein [Fibromonadaceae bacterium]|jgi:abortive infection bacteriophage resistance protein|nr:Abi family protein [Fibromonadaceae bacterium]